MSAGTHCLSLYVSFRRDSPWVAILETLWNTLYTPQIGLGCVYDGLHEVQRRRFGSDSDGTIEHLFSPIHLGPKFVPDESVDKYPPFSSLAIPCQMNAMLEWTQQRCESRWVLATAGSVSIRTVYGDGCRVFHEWVAKDEYLRTLLWSTLDVNDELGSIMVASWSSAWFPPESGENLAGVVSKSDARENLTRLANSFSRMLSLFESFRLDEPVAALSMVGFESRLPEVREIISTIPGILFD